MKSRTQVLLRRTASALALVTTIAVAPAFAAPEGGNPERMLERMAQHVDLSDSQRVEIGALLKAAAEEGAGDRARMQEIRRELQSQGASFDPTASESLTQELGAITARSAYRRTETRAAVRALLSEEQRTKLDAMESQRGKGREPGKMKGSRQD
ncbi:Spy/CpxP family protein refolding chaperone [Haliea sp.]|uniref:Spy/CpxP family protein refolding chaperone n=1 Tax=Haliea sp. TaxID=1932666 RepID=UPI003527A4C0